MNVIQIEQEEAQILFSFLVSADYVDFIDSIYFPDVVVPFEFVFRRKFGSVA
jgi:hypothetical protein